jgi:acyl transferase domain-containing protein
MARDRSLDIAVTGMAGRFPGAADLPDWWASLTGGRVLTRRYSRRELAEAGVPAALLNDPDFVPVHGHLTDADRFENMLFRVSPREAELMDPQHRLMLECAWEALEDAASDPRGTQPVTGVYASASGSGYLRSMIAGGALDPLTLEDAVHGNEPDFLASLISYKLDLTGPALAVQTACSSSLVAVHLAVQALLNGECDQALVVAAGMAYPQAGHLRVPGGIHSGTGRCRPFDATADGVVAGSGAACVVLRRLADALADGPVPHGIVLGTAVNNDGSAKAGYYAPSADGQEEVIRSALIAAGVDGAGIGYLETHGTGTAIGDPIEWSAASAALRAAGAGPGQVAVGALKANIGHLDNAAGLAGLIKALLVVREGSVPPVAGFTGLNPLLETDGTPLYVPAETGPWTGPEPRRAGVSSFGVGGTNAHVIVEQALPAAIEAAIGATASAPSKAEAPAGHLVLLSAADPAALQRSAERLAAHLAVQPGEPADVARTLATGRAELPERLAVVTTDGPEGAAELAERLASGEGVIRGSRPERGPAPLVLAFPGQGSQYPGMAGPLAAALPGFRSALDTCLEAFDPLDASRLREALFDPAFPDRELARTELAQPALFAVEYAAAVALRGLGATPAAVIGHSLGELTAACVAGVLGLRDAARLVCARGRAMQDCPEGAMLLLACNEEEACGLLSASEARVEIAAVNSPDATVVAGAPDEVEAFRGWLDGRVRSRLLPSDRAFHSALVEPALEALAGELARTALGPTSLYWATDSGRLLAPGERAGADLLVAQARRTVRFARALEELAAAFPGALVVETGPGRSVSAMAEAAGLNTVPLCPGRPPQSGSATHAAERGGAEVLEALGALWTAGQPLDTGVICGTGRLAHLPGYPFEGPRLIAPEALARPARADPAHPQTMPVQAARAAGTGEAMAAADVPALVVRLWTELLGHTALSEGADFFDLGGNSLVVTRLAQRLRKELGVRVPVRELLVHRSLGAQTTLVTTLLVSVSASATTV